MDFSRLLYTKDMGFFTQKQAAVYGVMDVGADAIKAVVFNAASEGARGRGKPDTAAGLPRVREKFVWDLPISCSPLRLVQKIRESVFAMTEKIRITPEKVVIALGPEVGEYALQSWVSPGVNAPLTRKHIRDAYQRLFEEHADLRRAMIAVPVDVLVNGYPWTDPDAAPGGADATPHGSSDEIVFQTMALSLSVENGALFNGLKNALAGIPLAFLPLVVAEKEALASALNIRDAFFIDVGADTTALLSVREGRLLHTAFMPMGIRRMAEIAAKNYRYSVRDARLAMRHYAEGGRRDEAFARASAAAAAGAAEWKENFLRALDAFYPTGPLSPMILLAGGGARYTEIRAVVEASDWLGGFSHDQKPVLRVLEGAAFFGGNTLGGNVQGPEDAGVAALMAYVMHHRPLF